MAEVKDKVVTVESLAALHKYDEATFLKTSGALGTLGITATASELNKLDGITATTSELNYVDGVTSNIQTQLNNKASSSHNHVGTVIPNGADLDDYMTVGIYFADSIQSDTYSITNIPSAIGDSTFVLEVLPASNYGSIIHRITRTAKTYQMVVERAYYDNAWGNWYTVSVSGMRVMWEGVYYMGSGQNVTFTEDALVSEQNHGIVLVWSGYSTANGTATDTNFQFHFIPKSYINMHNGYGCVCPLATASFSKVGVKYLYVNDNGISGHSSNNTTGTGSGITFDNTCFVLRYVLGV